MFGFNITILHILVWLISWPFRVVFSLNPFVRIKDNKLNKKLVDLIEEFECYAKYCNKGPTGIQSYKIKNVFPREMHYTMHFLHHEWGKQRTISFYNKINEDSFNFRTGARSAGGSRSYRKSRNEFEEIAKEAYLTIDSSTVDYRFNWNGYNDWKSNMSSTLINKYGVESFYYIRRALIILSHEPENARYVKAKEDLLEKFRTETKVNNFIKDVESHYAVKKVYEALLK